MTKLLSVVTVAALLSTLPSANAIETKPVPSSIKSSPKDWPWWRGPTHDGVATSGQKPPLKWSETDNVRWQVDLPGRGHGSPIVVGDQVILATADHGQNKQLVLSFDRASGKKRWERVVHDGGLETKGNRKASQASSTLACDGERLFINFLNRRAIHTTALDLKGKIIWQKRISDYVIHQGYGSSPTLYKSLVLVSADNKGGGAIAALNRATGNIAWKHDRPKTANYSSPVVVHAANRDQLIFTGCNLVSSFDPISGKKLWEIAGATTECVTSTVTDGKHIYTTGGYPKNHVAAIVADGSGKVSWENGTRVYVPSMLSKDGHIYAVADAGIAICWNSATGKELWKNRIKGAFTASPVMVNDLIYATSEKGVTYVFKASPQGFEQVAVNKLGDEMLATAAICDSRLYLRVAKGKAKQRKETLYSTLR